MDHPKVWKHVIKATALCYCQQFSMEKLHSTWKITLFGSSHKPYNFGNFLQETRVFVRSQWPWTWRNYLDAIGSKSCSSWKTIQTWVLHPSATKEKIQWKCMLSNKKHSSVQLYLTLCHLMWSKLPRQMQTTPPLRLLTKVLTVLTGSYEICITTQNGVVFYQVLILFLTYYKWLF